MREFSIIAVCTANICRSPAFETLLRDGTAGHAGLASDRVFLSSVGLRAVEGRETDPAMVRAMAKLGVEIPPGSSRRAADVKFDEADLILVATRRHRASVVRTDVTLRDRTFTYREFARFCAEAGPRPAGQDTADRLAALTAFAVKHRGELQPRRAEDDDVRDPYGRNRLAYRSAARLLASTAETILDAVGTGVAHESDRRISQ